MKTTTEISDALPRQARAIEREWDLHHVIADTRTGTPFRLRHPSFKGKGLQPEFRDVSWNPLRDAAYRDHEA